MALINQSDSDPAKAAAAVPIIAPTGALGALEQSLPPDVLARVTAYLKNPNLPAADAQTYALQYIRTTPWYAQKFPGIQAGINNGLFADESGYLAHQNQINQLYQQYLGRPATSLEVAHSVTQGLTASRIDAGLGGQAYIAANKPEIQTAMGSFGEGALTAPELQALGQQQKGIDSPLGELLQKRLTLAQQRITGVFNGSLAQQGLSFTSGRLAGVQASQPSDVAA